MGMAVSFGIIRRHNGSIEVESEPGRGTTFRISLPVAEAAEATADTSVGGTAQFGKTEDSEYWSWTMRRPCERYCDRRWRLKGCEVIVAESGEKALRLYDSEGRQLMSCSLTLACRR